MAIKGTTQDDTSEGSRAHYLAPAVVIVHSGRAPLHHVVPLVRGRLVLGRDMLAGAALEDPRLSREHAEIRFDGLEWTVEDRGSKNGTFVDGHKVEGGALTVAAPVVVRAGGTLFLPVANADELLARPLHREGDLVVGARVARVLEEVVAARLVSRTLLVLGESGSGKEHVARAFHEDGPFVPVNCAAIPGGVAERLLFGARRGAYSGVTEDADGYLQAADRGTLFLDELGDLPLDVQAKLLRAIETGEVLMLGASKPRRLSLRFAFATNKDLHQEVAAGRFRADLLYRIGTVVAVPPLRERREEIPWLVATAAGSVAGAPPAHARLVEACLLRPWPGNVRELLAEIRAAAVAAVRAGADAVRVEHLRPGAGSNRGAASATPPVAAAISSPPPAERTTPRTVTRAALEDAIARAGGNLAEAARLLGLHRTQIYRLMEQLGIERRRS